MTASLRHRLTLAGMAGAVLALVLAATGAGAQGVDSRSRGYVRSPDGRDRAVRVHNETGVVIASLSATRDGSRAGAAVQMRVPLAPGETASMIVDDGSNACLYDFQARLQDGALVSRQDVNVCEQYDVYYTR